MFNDPVVMSWALGLNISAILKELKRRALDGGAATELTGEGTTVVPASVGDWQQASRSAVVQVQGNIALRSELTRRDAVEARATLAHNDLEFWCGSEREFCCGSQF